jgi:hypothetical protein
MKNINGQHMIKLFLIGLVVALIGAILVMNWVPPTSRDALTHHLAIPKLYLKHGGMVEIPNLVFSYYPMNLDLLYTLPLYFGNDILPKYIHFSFALLTAGLIYAYLKRRSNTLCALAGILFFLSIPVIVRLSTTVYVDLGLVFFATLALIYFMKWAETDFKPTYLLISATGCGLALGTKYNAMILLLIMVLFVPFIYAKRKKKPAGQGGAGAGFMDLKVSLRAIGHGGIYVVVALAIFSPWAIRNYAWTDNPVYPLFDRYLNRADKEDPRAADPEPRAADPGISDPTDTASAELHIISSPFVTRKLLFGEPWWQTMLIPLRIFFQGKDNRPKQFDGRLNPYLLLLPMFAFFIRTRGHPTANSERIILLAFAALFIIIAFFKADMRMRYISPAIPPLVILSVLGLRNLFERLDNRFAGRSRGFCRSIVIVVVAGLLALNVAYIGHLCQRINPLSYISGQLSRDQYIEHYRPEYAALRFANQRLSQNARILGLFLGNRSYYSERDLVFGDGFFKHTVIREDSAREILEALKSKKITHILVYYRILKRWSGHNFNHDERLRLQDFFNYHANLIFHKGEYGLYQL